VAKFEVICRATGLEGVTCHCLTSLSLALFVFYCYFQQHNFLRSKLTVNNRDPAPSICTALHSSLDLKLTFRGIELRNTDKFVGTIGHALSQQGK
jgi:hypothetical protein